MLTRRGLIRIGAASVGTLALRPFGLLPGLAQSGPDYRALVCVFLFGGNDSNNMIVPMDDTSYKAYTSIRGSLALTASDLTTVNSVSGAPYAFHAKLPELATLFTSKELAVVANVGSLVQPRIPISNCSGRLPWARETVPLGGRAGRLTTSPPKTLTRPSSRHFCQWPAILWKARASRRSP
jgi:uncharacterized protein (DUF1501 family)